MLIIILDAGMQLQSHLRASLGPISYELMNCRVKFGIQKKLSFLREAMWCSVSLRIFLNYLRSCEMTLWTMTCISYCLHSVVTLSVWYCFGDIHHRIKAFHSSHSIVLSYTIFQLFDAEKNCDCEIKVRVTQGQWNVLPFDRLHPSSCWYSTLTMALSCILSNILNIE